MGQEDHEAPRCLMSRAVEPGRAGLADSAQMAREAWHRRGDSGFGASGGGLQTIAGRQPSSNRRGDPVGHTARRRSTYSPLPCGNRPVASTYRNFESSLMEPLLLFSDARPVSGVSE